MTIELVPVEGYEYAAVFIPELNIKAPAGCLLSFPQFQEDFETLRKNKIITVDKKKIKFKWRYSHTSLAQYFYNLEKPIKYFWSIVEFDFYIKPHTLKHLISINKRIDHSKDCKDYAKLKKLLNR